MSSEQSRHELDALRRAITRRGPEPVILIWIKAKPRVSTMRPLAATLGRAGFAPLVVHASGLGLTSDDIAAGEGITCFRVPAAELTTLKGVAVFISSEQDVGDGPVDAARVAIHHSLPDYEIKRDYAKMLAQKPAAVATADYYAILVKQPDAHWKAERFAPNVDRILPAALLRHRRKSLAIVPFGYPKIDRMMAEDTSAILRDTITYAPTQSTLGFSSVKKRGAQILGMLLRDFPDHRIAFRPYPGQDVRRLRDMYGPFLGNDRFVLDESLTGQELLRRTALLVTDRSSVAVSFGLGFARPVMFFRNGGLLESDNDTFQKVDPIGLRAGSIKMLRRGVRRLLARSDRIAERVVARRGDHIYNPGRSVDYLAEIMPDIIANRSRPEWLEVPRRPFPGWTAASKEAQFKVLMGRVDAVNPMGSAKAYKVLEAGFRASPRNGFRTRMRSLRRRIRGLPRYLFHPRGPWRR